MKIFLDTSSLFKLYHQEEGTLELEKVFSTEHITHVFPSEITKVEFSSTLWKKVRTKELTTEVATNTLIMFEQDFNNFTFISTDSLLLEKAKRLLSIHGSDGLRTLDSIQLATCISLADDADVFFTADKLLQNLLSKNGLKTNLENKKY